MGDRYNACVEKVIEALILALAAWPLLRLSTDSGLRSLLPRAALGLVVLNAAWLAGVVLLLLHAPAALRPLAALALLGMAWTWWRSRSRYGAGRRLPPGSLGFVGSLRSLLDHRFYLEQWRRHGPVFKTRQAHRPLACVVGLGRAHELLQRHEEALRLPPLPFNRHIPGGFLRYMEPKTHRAYRPLFQAAFSRRVVDACEPFIARVTQERLAGMAEGSQTNGGGVNPRPHLEGLVLTIFLRVFLGVEPGTEIHERLTRLYPGIDHRPNMRQNRRRFVSDLESIEAIVNELADRIADREGSAHDSFLAEMVRLHPESRRDRTVVVNLLYVLQTTRIDVAGLLTWILKKLTDHPEWSERVRNEDTEGEGSLAERVVMETLRLEQSEFLYREVHDEFEVEGHRVPRGWLLRVCVRESHRDPAVFEDPETYDPDRFLERRYGWNEYSPFGLARHSCIGRDLTRTIGRIFVRELTAGYEWTAVGDGSREACGRHWDHWRPSSRFRVRLVPRPGARTISQQ